MPWGEGEGEERRRDTCRKDRMETGQHLPNFVIKHCLFRMASWIGELSNEKLKKKAETKKSKTNEK